MKFAVFGVNFGMPQKSRTKTHEIPAAHPLAGGAVLVAVEGPSPSLGGRENYGNPSVPKERRFGKLFILEYDFHS